MRVLLLPVSVLLLLACAGGGTTDEGDKPPGILDDHDVDDDGYLYEDDCNDQVASVNPGATEVCDPGDVDEDCNGLADNADPDVSGGIVAYPDRDLDGFGDASAPAVVCELLGGYTTDASDCDDGDSSVHPGATERCDDADVDEDCDGGADNLDPEGGDGELLAYEDEDGDGYGTTSGSVCDLDEGWAAEDGDCDDDDASVSPGADERCNGQDDDCDGSTDESEAVDAATWFRDRDGDGHGDDDDDRDACSRPSGYVEEGGDCDDDDASSHPDGREVCDDADNDCDGAVDDAASDAPTWFVDSDADGYGTSSATRVQCDRPSGYAANDDDCDDASAGVSPAGSEVCDSADVDEDCDGDADDADSSVSGITTWYRDADGDGYGLTSVASTVCDRPSSYVATGGDCDDANAARSPGATEVCDASNTDEDCDGRADDSDTSVSVASKLSWYSDYDGDGYGYYVSRTQCDSPGAGYITTGGDCGEFYAHISPGATEVCDGEDNDCDGLTDEADSSLVADVWRADADGDGYGDPSGASVVDCDAPVGYGEGTDCDDGDDGIYPGATDECFDGIDGNCDGADRCTPTTSEARLRIFDDYRDIPTTLTLVGDVDGDGVTDFAASTHYTGLGRGRALIFSGAGAGDLTPSDALATASIGSQDYGNGGENLVTVDDVTGDGLPDLWGGAPDEEWNSTYSDGAAYLMDGRTLERVAHVTGVSYYGNFGNAIASLGDWDGDGDEDVIIGASNASDHGYAGSAYVLDADQSGSGTIVSALATTTFYSSDYRIAPGGNVCNLGDTDGDGVTDIGLSSDYSEYGYSFVVHSGVDLGAVDIVGDPSLTGTRPLRCAGGDVDGDGYADIVLEDYLDGLSHAWLVYGPISGSTPVSTAASASYRGEVYDSLGRVGMRDFDGDGRDEWIVGSPWAMDERSYQVGNLLIFDGSATGALEAADARLFLTGTEASSGVGETWAFGDLDGDGVDELVLGGNYEAWVLSMDELF